MRSAQEIRDILLAKLPDGTIVPEHTATSHFYRHVPSGKLFDSVTAMCGIFEMDHLKRWAAKLAAAYVLDVMHEESLPLSKERYSEIQKLAILQHQNIFEDAGTIGTVGHNAVEDYLDEWMLTGNKPADIKTFVKSGSDHRAIALARSAEMFCNDYSIEPVASEMRVCSLKHGYAGTLDSLFIGIIPKRGQERCTNGDSHVWLGTSSRDASKQVCAVCGLKAKKQFILGDWKSSNSIDKMQYAMQTVAYWYALEELTGLKAEEILIVRIDKFKAHYEVRRVLNRPSVFKAFQNAVKMYYWIKSDQKILEKMQARDKVSLDSLFEEI